MERADSVLRKLTDQPDGQAAIRCRRCGALVDFPSGCWSKSCPACGQRIEASRRLQMRWGRVRQEEPRCAYCRDTGIVIMTRQLDDQVYEYGYRCICAAGQARPETGIPLAVDVDLMPAVRAERGVRDARA